MEQNSSKVFKVWVASFSDFIKGSKYERKRSKEKWKSSGKKYVFFSMLVSDKHSRVGTGASSPSKNPLLDEPRTSHAIKDRESELRFNANVDKKGYAYYFDRTVSKLPETQLWHAAFEQHSLILPYTATPSILTSIPLNAKDVGKDASRFQAAASSGIHYPYQIALSKIENISLPKCITDSYLSSDGPLLLEIRASLFDLESGRFFGKTWVHPDPINLRTSKLVQSSIKLNHKHPSRNPENAKKKTRRASDTDDSQSSEGDDDSDNSSKEDNDDHDGLLSKPVSGTSHKISLNASNLCLYFHTSLKSEHIVTVLEFIFYGNNYMIFVELVCI